MLCSENRLGIRKIATEWKRKATDKEDETSEEEPKKQNRSRPPAHPHHPKKSKVAMETMAVENKLLKEVNLEHTKERSAGGCRVAPTTKEP